MGFYADQVVPRAQARVMDRADLREVRARVCAGLSGDVLEIGFGTGLNVPFYPPEVTRVTAVEPSAVCLRIAGPQIAGSRVPVTTARLSGEHLDLPSQRFDAVLSTWTLCSIPDLQAALGELRRVLKPGGRLCFIEHGLAPDARIARWQKRVEPAWRRLAGGCHLTRPVADCIEQAGFALDKLDTYYRDKEPKLVGYAFEGVAVSR